MSVFAWGANSHGQLGLGFESELCMAPQKLSKFSFVPGSVRSIRGGGGHVLVLDTCGRIHACGWNNRGQLGLDSDQECHSTFERVPSEFFEEVPIERIACGWDISGCITVTKKLYMWGSNTFQQLGICQRGFTAVRRPLPVTLPRGDLPRRICFGLRHCAILTEDYKVYVFGRLRINDPPPTELCLTTTTLSRATVLKIVPRLVHEQRIVAMTSGQNHLLLKILDMEHENSTKRIIALGDNKFGQSNSFHFEENVKQIGVGWTHNAVLLKNNRIFVWGRNCYGQLGIGDLTECQPTPVLLNLPNSVVPAHLHVGSEHTLLRTTAGSIYTWGWNEHGNCGNQTTENLCTPTSIELPAPSKLAGAGAGFCYAICDSA